MCEGITAGDSSLKVLLALEPRAALLMHKGKHICIHLGANHYEALVVVILHLWRMRLFRQTFWGVGNYIVRLNIRLYCYNSYNTCRATKCALICQIRICMSNFRFVFPCYSKEFDYSLLHAISFQNIVTYFLISSKNYLQVLHLKRCAVQLPLTREAYLKVCNKKIFFFKFKS